MKNRRWERGKKNGRVLRFNCDYANAVIFGAEGVGFYASAVWAHKNKAEGIEFSMASARLKANAELDRIEAEQA